MDEPGALDEVSELIGVEAEPLVAHPLPVLLAVVGNHLDHEEAAARAQDPEDLVDDGPGARRMVEGEDRQGDVEVGVGDGQLLELARSDVGVLAAPDAFPRGGEHVVRAVDGHDPGDEGAQRRGDASGAAAEVSDDGVRVEEREEGYEIGTGAEELVPQVVPVPGGRREELLAPEAALPQDLGQPGPVAPDDRIPAELGTQETPERVLVGRRPGTPVEVGRPLSPGPDPVALRQDLEVAADRRLGELEHRAEVSHGELVLVEDGEQAATGEVGDDRGAFQDLGAGGHGRGERDSRIASIRESGSKDILGVRLRQVFGQYTPVVASRPAGFSLLEAVFALAVLGVALLVSMSFLTHRARFADDLEVHRDALRTLAVAQEAWRAGISVPTTPTPGGLDRVWEVDMPEGAMLWTEQRSTDDPALRALDFVIRYPASGRFREVRITTLVEGGVP